PRGIGDIVLSTIILDNIAEYFPSVKIDYLVEDFAKESLQNNPLVNKILTMENKEFSLKAASRIRKEKYNLILDLWSNPGSAQITFLSGVKYRVGFAYRGRKYAYNILASSSRGEHHSAEHNLELLGSLGVPVISKRIHYYVSEKDNSFGKAFIKNNFGNDAVIGIIPSGGWASKRCDASKWVEICKAIFSIYKVRFLILWGPGDEGDANYIKNNLPDETVLAPDTNLSSLSGLINNCDIVMANDSGPMHISTALGIPTLGLFGPTNPKMHGPYSEKSDYVIKEDLFCIICNLQQCRYKHECFLDLSLEDIIAKVESLIIKNNLSISRK
ncbi:MAG: glycosyltransferase family 9 protein, partial [Ignavibacteriaceae bacterium]